MFSAVLHQYLHGQLILKNLSPSATSFFPKVLHLVNNFLSNNFLPEIDLGYVQLIKVTTPDGMIPIKLFNVT